jgi:hypothetical protein
MLPFLKRELVQMWRLRENARIDPSGFPLYRLFFAFTVNTIVESYPLYRTGRVENIIHYVERAV